MLRFFATWISEGVARGVQLARNVNVELDAAF